VKHPLLPIAPGETVRVHRNLNPVRMDTGETLEGLWVVRVNRSGKWLHAGYRREVTIANCVPHATAGGVRRIEKRGRRDVVAWITGSYVADVAELSGVEVHYNPYRSADFTLEDGTAYTGSSLAAFPAGASYFLSRD